MTYSEVLNFLYHKLPVFHREGKKAFKPGLQHIQYLCNYFGNPEKKLKCLHIAGTNGKGSSSHLMASILQEHGYKVGLYTSPHLKNFTERFKINGNEIPEKWIVDFVNSNKELIENYQASFFEWTVIMAFLYFEEYKVDYAVIETGLGGRLDSTNIIEPIACLITNISFDHQDILGNTLEEIAIEKAGIIKPNTPVTISEFDTRTVPIFNSKAYLEHSPILFAREEVQISSLGSDQNLQLLEINSIYWEKFNVKCPLLGSYQRYNIQGIIAWAAQLSRLNILSLEKSKIQQGISQVIQNTQLKGRFQTIHAKNPEIIVDTAHNESGIQHVLQQIAQKSKTNLTIVIGMVKDKDVKKVISLLPDDASYLFTEITNPRRLPKEELMKLADDAGKQGILIENVNAAIDFVKAHRKNDLVLIFGSTYLIAEINDL